MGSWVGHLHSWGLGFLTCKTREKATVKKKKKKGKMGERAQEEWIIEEWIKVIGAWQLEKVLA